MKYPALSQSGSLPNTPLYYASFANAWGIPAALLALFDMTPGIYFKFWINNVLENGKASDALKVGAYRSIAAKLGGFSWSGQDMHVYLVNDKNWTYQLIPASNQLFGNSDWDWNRLLGFMMTSGIPEPAAMGFPGLTSASAAPVVQAPAVQAPAVQAPVVQAPVVQAPVVQAPAVQAPVVQVPINSSPIITESTVAPPTSSGGSSAYEPAAMPGSIYASQTSIAPTSPVSEVGPYPSSSAIDSAVSATKKAVTPTTLLIGAGALLALLVFRR